MKKKLIEVALPLEAINFQAAREKSIRHGHPSTLHLWWARRPLAACRSVLFASLVDDPSSNHDKFPTIEEQETERQRLFGIIERLVDWDNIKDEKLYKEAHEEILKSTNGNPPPVLDPFAGGGSIPLEAQRLGLEAHASDLNPVAVLINKALIEIPPKFKDMPPVNPKAREKIGANTEWKGAAGLAEDVRYYGEWMKERAFEKIGHLYPKIEIPATDTVRAHEATVIAWIWARTVKCPNPACGAQMPLISSYWLSKKKGKEAWVEPVVDNKNKTITFQVKTGKGKAPDPPKVGRGAQFRCEVCGQVPGDKHIKAEGLHSRMGAQLMAIVAEGQNGRIYISPDKTHAKIANMPRPNEYPDGPIADDRRSMFTPLYGLTNLSHLFTPRQLTALVTFSDLVGEAIAQVQTDAITTGLTQDGKGLDADGTGAKAYGEAVGVYLAMVIDKLTDYHNSICSWHSSRDIIRNIFARQAIPMVWDYAEGNLFCDSSGSYNNMLEWVFKALRASTPNNNGFANQKDAAQLSFESPIIISTDPPYYDNIGYADLSDFFYIWLRRSLNNVYPTLFSTMLVPKAEELVATPYRFDGNKNKAKAFFENGMLQAFSSMRKTVSQNFPLTVYYAYKQTETEEDEDKANNNEASSGWETMLQAIIKAGFSITGTWPLRTEMANRTVASQSNALASSIAIVCRPRSEDASSTTRRAFQTELQDALKTGLRDLQSGNIAPVDLAQASIGPGIAVYSKYKEIVKVDDTVMSVREALVMINQELDAYLSAQEGTLDSNSRFCIAWFEEYGMQAAEYGRAETLAKAKIAYIQDLVDEGVLESGRGKVRLIKRSELPADWNIGKVKSIWALVQGLCLAMDKGGKGAVAAAMADITRANPGAVENIKSLAYRAYMIAERKGWSDEALAYNSLVSMWSDISAEAARIIRERPEPLQGELEL